MGSALPSADELTEDGRSALKKPVGAVLSALSILRCLGAADGTLRLSDIVKSLDLNSSTVLNILRTLEHEGVVVFDRSTKRYGLGSGLEELARPLYDRRDQQRRLQRSMQATAQDIGATVLYWRRIGEHVELIGAAESADAMRLAFTLGGRVPIFFGAIGRLIAGRSEYSPEQMTERFDRVRWSRPPTYKKWLDEVALARKTGAGIDLGNANIGVLGVAVPVETDGPLEHILSAAMFEQAGSELDVTSIVERLKGLARERRDSLSQR